MNPLTINYAQYQFAHGKLPKGRGTWAFFFDNQTEPYFSSPNQTFTQALNDAKRYAVANGYWKITIGS